MQSIMLLYAIGYDMTLAELVENGFIAIDTGLLSISVYLTIVSGYLIVAYMAGNKLSRFQVYSISFLFVSFSLIMTLSTFAALRNGMQLLALTRPAEEVDLVSELLEFSVYGVALLELVGVFLALKFMSDERGRST